MDINSILGTYDLEFDQRHDLGILLIFCFGSDCLPKIRRLSTPNVSSGYFQNIIRIYKSLHFRIFDFDRNLIHVENLKKLAACINSLYPTPAPSQTVECNGSRDDVSDFFRTFWAAVDYFRGTNGNYRIFTNKSLTWHDLTQITPEDVVYKAQDFKLPLSPVLCGVAVLPWNFRNVMGTEVHLLMQEYREFLSSLSDPTINLSGIRQTEEYTVYVDDEDLFRGFLWLENRALELGITKDMEFGKEVVLK